MLSACTSIIDLHGARRLAALIQIFEDHLAQQGLSSNTDDYIKEAVVILFGRVARHLEASDKRIPNIVDRLVDALKTPAEQVQMAVSECLSPLVKLMRPRLASLVDNLFVDLLQAPKYATRRGAAYSLAGVIQGTGIAGMKEFDIIGRLRRATEDKKKFEPRQGVMFAFETLFNTLGRLFEPYITYALPLLLTSLGDSTTDVREATQDAARIIMQSLSGYGVKLILPTLLEGLDEKQWRSKKHDGLLLTSSAFHLVTHRYPSPYGCWIPSKRRYSTLLGSLWTTSALLWVLPTHPLCARLLWKCQQSLGKMSVVWIRLSRSYRKLCNTPWSTPRSSSSMVCRRQKVSCSTVLLVQVKPCLPKPLPTNAMPTSSVSR